MFPEGGGFVNITDPEGGPTGTGMILEGSTTEKMLPSPPHTHTHTHTHRLINGTALTAYNVWNATFVLRYNVPSVLQKSKKKQLWSSQKHCTKTAKKLDT